MKLTLIRHGQTESNAQGLMQGSMPGKLDVQGLEQANQVSERLKDEQYDVIYSSDLHRAKQTTEIICKHHPHTKVVYTQVLRERQWGVLEGRKKEDVIKMYTAEGVNFIDFKPQGGESLSDVQHRAFTFYNMLLDKHPHDAVLLISHGGVIASLLLSVLKKDVDLDNYLSVRQTNTGVTVLDIDKDKQARLVLLNDTAHLTAPSKDRSD